MENLPSHYEVSNMILSHLDHFEKFENINPESDNYDVKVLLDDSFGVMLTMNNKRIWDAVKITLNIEDLFDVTFFKNETVKEIKNVTTDEMIRVFKEETGFPIGI